MDLFGDMSDAEILAAFTVAALLYLAVAAALFLIVKLTIFKLKGKRFSNWIFVGYMVIVAILPLAFFRTERLLTARNQQAEARRNIQNLRYELYTPKPIPPGLKFDQASFVDRGRGVILLHYRGRSGQVFVDLELGPREGYFSVDPTTGACAVGTSTKALCRPIPTPKGRELYEFSTGSGIALIGSTAIGLDYGLMPADQLAAFVDSLVETDPDTIKFEGLD